MFGSMIPFKTAVTAAACCLSASPCFAQHAGPASSGPTLFADGVISDSREQWRISFSPDGLTAWFAASDEFFPVSRKATIYFSRLVDGSWSTPVIAPFSGRYTDIDPCVSPDGSRLYFASIRPIGDRMPSDIDLWMVKKTGDGWGEPIHLGPEVNSPEDELYPSESADGTLYFASGPSRPEAGKHWDIYAASRSGDGFTKRSKLGSGVNTDPSPDDRDPTAAWEFNPEISRDGNTLYFTSLRPGAGFGDIYVSRRVDGEWSHAQRLGSAVNTEADEYHPTISPDGAHLYFVRRRPARGNFYRIPIAELESGKR
jgi:Tol biopolymer transport system component